MEFPAVSAASGWGSAGLGGEYVAGDLAGRDGSAGSGVAAAAQQFASGGVKASCHGLVEVGWGSAHREAGSSVTRWLVKILRKIADDANVGSCGTMGVITTLEFLQHLLA
jgi:hypothetical protein